MRLKDAIHELQRKNAMLLLTGVQEQPLDMLRKINIVPGLVPDEHLFGNIGECTSWLRQHMRHDGLQAVT